MLTRSKTSLAIGMSCAAGAALAGGAVAHGGGGHGSRAGLEVHVRGVVSELVAATSTDPGTITVSPGGTLASWTCTLRDGADVGELVVGTTTVKLKCRSRDGVLRAKRMRVTDDDSGRVKVRATGLVTEFSEAGGVTKTPATPATPATPTDRELFDKGDIPTAPADPAVPAVPGTATDGTPGSITVDPGSGLPTVTCAITGRTRVRTAPVVGTSMARITCRSRDDALVAKTVRVKGERSGSAKKAGGATDRKGRR